MERNTRLALIKSRYLAKVGAPIAGLLPIGRREIRAVVRETVVPVATEEEEIPFASSLQFDKVVETKEKETDYLLTAKERRQIKPILRKASLQANSSLALQDGAVENPVEITGESGEIFPSRDDVDYLPILARDAYAELHVEIDRETAAVLFESDYDENPIDFDPSLPANSKDSQANPPPVVAQVRGPLSLAENAEDSFELVEFTQDISEDPSEFEQLRQRVLAMAR